MTEETFDWRSFLTRWSAEWAGTYGSPDELPAAADEPAWHARWLGAEPAAGERITAVEELLGHRLPPSYRAFLEVSDGWRHAGGFVHRLAGSGEARWHEDASGLSEYYGEGELKGMWGRALQLDVESDMTTVLLDPLAVGEDGEWAVYCHKSWAACEPARYGSFREFMRDMYREFHSLTAHFRGPAFVNETTRRLDAQVERARLDALCGEHERAAAALTEAAGFGRPRALGMGDQLRRLHGQTSTVHYGGLAQDPLHSGEFVPLLAVEHVAQRRDADSWARQLSSPSDEHREAAEEVLREVTERTFRYTARGPFGEAVERAREQARWGRTEAAWRTLRSAMPRWTPLGPDHLAPVGLLADPLLGPLITPERGRELLAVPRGPEAAEHSGEADEAGEVGEAGEAWAAEPADGLVWLADPPPGNRRPEPYRFVLVEGAGPAELPVRLGGQDAVLDAPVTHWELNRSRFRGRTSSSYEDCAVVTVGHAGGPGWSFALDRFPAGHIADRFVSPAVAASLGAAQPEGAVPPGARAVVVWCEPERGLFHLSVAERGIEQYAFTVDGPEVRSSGGPIPSGLDPAALFATPAVAVPVPGEGAPDRTGERRALTAIAAEFGVGLPRFAITEGRLHTFTTRSWTRPPGPGETYAIFTFGGPPE
ncbi:SMI1/KNR4 family protein [Kitasatospora sp. NPDC094011]|uniref:SMI1/KNR4 family protein n=1 Tax=Kitasatospora sp. NPDC094011 TaxID=3364090 RepID=UPI003807C40C